MVEVGMGEEEVGVERTVALDALAELPQPGPGIEDQEPPAATDFETGRVAAVALRFGTGVGETAAHAPETDEEVRPVGHSISTPRPALRRTAFRPPALTVRLGRYAGRTQAPGVRDAPPRKGT